MFTSGKQAGENGTARVSRGKAGAELKPALMPTFLTQS
jgi:hypothetical protein